MTTPQVGLERRRADLERIDEASVAVHKVSGRQLTLGVGESLLDVNFPVIFTEVPSFTFGAELDVNLSAVDGWFPTVSAVVIKWKATERMTNIFYYTGAVIAVVTTGLDTDKIWIHWNMEGKAFRNPTDSGGNTDTAI